MRAQFDERSRLLCGFGCGEHLAPPAPAFSEQTRRRLRALGAALGAALAKIDLPTPSYSRAFRELSDAGLMDASVKRTL